MAAIHHCGPRMEEGRGDGAGLRLRDPQLTQPSCQLPSWIGDHSYLIHPAGCCTLPSGTGWWRDGHMWYGLYHPTDSHQNVNNKCCCCNQQYREDDSPKRTSSWFSDLLLPLWASWRFCPMSLVHPKVMVPTEHACKALMERWGAGSPGSIARHTGMITIHGLHVWETLEGPRKPGTFFYSVVQSLEWFSDGIFWKQCLRYTQSQYIKIVRDRRGSWGGTWSLAQAFPVVANKHSQPSTATWAYDRHLKSNRPTPCPWKLHHPSPFAPLPELWPRALSHPHLENYGILSAPAGQTEI